MSQSIHASTPPSSGDPDPAWCQAMPANLSSSLDAKRRQIPSWSSARMLTQKDPAASMRGHVLELRPAKKATSGGSSDTEAKEPTAMPTGPSPSSAVMTVTPVGKWPRTWRNLAESNEGGVVTKGEE